MASPNSSDFERPTIETKILFSLDEIEVRDIEDVDYARLLAELKEAAGRAGFYFGGSFKVNNYCAVKIVPGVPYMVKRERCGAENYGARPPCDCGFFGYLRDSKS